jgi:hypothetical protein
LDAQITPNIYYEVLNQYQSAQLLFEAIKLDVFSYLDKPTTAKEIANETGYDEQNVELLLLALSSCSYIDKENNSYCNTKAGVEYLSRKSPNYIGQTIIFRETMTSLSDIGIKVKHGSEKEAGIGYDFATLAEVTVPEMYATGRVENFVSEIKTIFTDRTKQYKILDLGGGSGILAIEFTKNYPYSKAYVFEFPNVAVTTKKIITQHDMGDRVSILTGDFNTDKIGSSYDMVIASGILDFTTDDLDSFMSKISESLLDKGYLLLIGRYSDTEGYTQENILGWLSGYMDGIKPSPTRSRVENALSKAQLQLVRSIQSGRFQGYLYKKVMV